MEEIKRYTIEACRDYSDCWLDVSEAIEQDYLTEELYCKDVDVQGLEKQISYHKAVVETLRQELKQNQIEYGEMQKNLHFTENENKMLQNKIDELEKIINSLATYNCRTCGHNIVEQGFNRVHNHTETCSNCYRCNNWIEKGINRY